MESVGSTLPDPKGICYYYINPETKEGMKVARMDPKDHNPHLVGKFQLESGSLLKSSKPAKD